MCRWSPHVDRRVPRVEGLMWGRGLCCGPQRPYEDSEASGWWGLDSAHVCCFPLVLLAQSAGKRARGTHPEGMGLHVGHLMFDFWFSVF